MLKEAEKQLKSISIEQIKEILKSKVKSEYDKIIINNDTVIKRANYYYSVLKYKKAERKLYAITFPLFDSIKNDFLIFEGGVGRFGQKSIIEYDGYIKEFSEIDGAKLHVIPLSDVGNAFDAPFDTQNNEIINIQRKYFLPKLTFKETCTKCNGNKYIACTNPECNGKHVWRCRECIGTGKVTCSRCNGHGYTKCWCCHGTGTNTKNEYRNGQLVEKTVKCSVCIGKGEVACNKCGATGKVRCKTCGGDGEITCKYCYSDRERYGMIDCPVCHATGSIGQIVYVETIIEDLESSKLLTTGDKIELDKDKIIAHVKGGLNFITVYKNTNGSVIDIKDDISSMLTRIYEEELQISTFDFPMVLKEEIIYQVIPSFCISYKHMLTNEYHELSVINIWDNPEVIFHYEAEKLKVNINSLSKTVGGVFSKVFKTKGHLKKEDRKTEIRLLIYLAKSDGKIEEQEKEYLSEQISNLKEFRNSEKKELFNLMNSDELPELTMNDVKFSVPEKGKEIIEKLTQLAYSDGELEGAEKRLIEKIKSLMSDE